jgi:hypothetical protein
LSVLFLCVINLPHFTSAVIEVTPHCILREPLALANLPATGYNIDPRCGINILVSGVGWTSLLGIVADNIQVSDTTEDYDNCSKVGCTGDKGGEDRSNGKIGKREPICFLGSLKGAS